MGLAPAQAEFVERAGRCWEGSGHSRTAGRILGWLMICEPRDQSSSALAAALAVSAGSVSTITRQLLRMGLVDRVTYPGDRASYFRLHGGVWLTVIDAALEEIRGLRALAEAGREVLPATGADRVQELWEMTGFMLEEWPRLMEQMAAAIGTRGVRT
jgi:DNA-binding transcriptional regulator GbsR (MarR family)